MWTILAGNEDPRDFEYHRTRNALFERVNGSSPRRTRTSAGFADTKRPMKALNPRSVAGSAASKRACTKYNPGRAKVCAGHISIKRLTAEDFPPGRSVCTEERSAGDR